MKVTLERLAADSATRLQALLDGGLEIPYEVNESDGTQLPQYAPMTERFVRENLDAIRGSEAFVVARAAIGADVSGRYLEELGYPVPPEPAARAEQALIEFLACVWRESSGFELDPERVRAAVAELEGTARPAPGDAQLVTPLIGFQLPLERLELAGATLVRADLADVPADARRVERTGTAPWEPVFLAILHSPRAEAGGEKPEPVGAMLRRLLTTLKLFKAGGIATGPQAWVSAGGESWRQVSTGAPRPRAGGYRLAESELASVADLARRIRDHPRRLEPLRHALSRFEAGLERGATLDSLNDHLLALRYMLEGDGPARSGLAMRAGALSLPPERDHAKALVEHALALEKELWSGEPAHGGRSAQTPAHLAGEIEELVRRILRDAASGRIGTDLRAAADEALLGDGLSVGGGTASDLGGSAEWGPAGDDSDVLEPEAGGPADHGRAKVLQPSARSSGVGVLEPSTDRVAQPSTDRLAQPSTDRLAQPERAVEVKPVVESDRDGWLDAVDAEYEAIEWPERPAALKALDSRDVSVTPSDRLAHFFPRTETEWTIGELRYERSRRAAAS